MTVPNILANGIGNWPDANKFMDNFDYLDAIGRGVFVSNPGFEVWTGGTSFTNPASGTAVADGWTWAKAGTTAPTANISREPTTKDSGLYSIKVDITVAGSGDSNGEIKQANLNYSRFAGLTVVFGARVKASTANKVRLKIYDGVTTAYSSYHTGDGNWQTIYVASSLSSSLTQLTSSIMVEPSDFTGQIYCDGGFLYVVRPSISTAAKAALSLNPPDSGDLANDIAGKISSSRTISTTGLLTGGGDLSANRTFNVPAATQSDQETGTSTSVAVVPNVQHHHVSAAKAWTYFTTVTTTSNLASYNVSSLTDNGVGDTTINFTTSFSSANYVAAVSIKTASGIAGLSRVSSKTSSALRILTFDTSSGAIDVGHMDAVFFGDL